MNQRPNIFEQIYCKIQTLIFMAIDKSHEKDDVDEINFEIN